MKKQKKFSALAIVEWLIIAIVVIVGGIFIYQKMNPPAKLDLFHSVLPVATTSQAITTTTGWQTINNAEFSFSLQYPPDFFDFGHEPKILSGVCNYQVFPNACPNINPLVAKDLTGNSGDVKAISDNLAAANYWLKPQGEKLTVNQTDYCLYQSADAAMGHVYNDYYYVTIKNNNCFIVTWATDSENCDFYLPLEKDNAVQKKNYEACVAKNKQQPAILQQIISTFNFGGVPASDCSRLPNNCRPD